MHQPRSTGSILKLGLYACMLNDGKLLPTILINYIPSNYGGYTPQNFNRTYYGLVPANIALIKTHNIAAVNLLYAFVVNKFYHKLQNPGISSLVQPPKHCGLTLILGGTEASLWEISNIYASMVRAYNLFLHNGVYYNNTFNTNTFTNEWEKPAELTEYPVALSAGSIYLMLQAMQAVKRPASESAWEYIRPHRKIPWETGTSFGYKDAWAIVTDGFKLVEVWCGNADGEGRPGLTG